MALEVEYQRAPLDAPASARAAQQGLHPRQQLRGREGLGQVVVGPAREALDPVALAAAGGEHEDGQVLVAAVGAQALEQPDPGFVG
ncbi:Uncharacterised protein [Acinetobacter baumannii]|nr:Uncharacterised protein [Acinetobacter baumannii]